MRTKKQGEVYLSTAEETNAYLTSRIEALEMEKKHLRDQAGAITGLFAISRRRPLEARMMEIDIILDGLRAIELEKGDVT